MFGEMSLESTVVMGKYGSFCRIGRAGEKQVRYASIIVDGRYAAGRGARRLMGPRS